MVPNTSFHYAQVCYSRFPISDPKRGNSRENPVWRAWDGWVTKKTSGKAVLKNLPHQGDQIAKGSCCPQEQKVRFIGKILKTYTEDMGNGSRPSNVLLRQLPDVPGGPKRSFLVFSKFFSVRSLCYNKNVFMLSVGAYMRPLLLLKNPLFVGQSGHGFAVYFCII